ncbi:NGG1p interacting factor NIF3 [Candidatus Parcubacteria bacterium]|nr:MAG: NGG1p interacting factor NIF3 [Candidatus Parcubacteria bacterium]
MTIQEIYELAIKMGIEADPRGKDGVKRFLERVKKGYEDLPKKDKDYFDLESLKNPYSDSRILFGGPKTRVKKILAGIDADATEIILADRLGEKGKKIDMVISHHPMGHALASLFEVMDVQVEMFAEIGVPVNVAHALFEERKDFVKRRFAPVNHSQTVDVAKILGIPVLSMHTIWDNLGSMFMKKHLGEKRFDTVGEVLDSLREITEYREARKGKAGPAIVSGNKNSRAGKVVVGFTGGTNASKELYVEMAKAGVGTIVEMHLPDETVMELRKLHINIIDAGHMASDSIGSNIFLDELEKRGVEVIPCSGLIRVKRFKQ